MPSQPLRTPVSKDRFSPLFSTLKTQVYHDPSIRGPGSHTIRSIAWNPTGHLIATGSADKTLRIWNPEKNQVKNSTELRGHTGGIERVAWNPTKEAELASVSSDCTCKFWDVRNKTCLATVQLGEPGFSVTWAADGSFCLVGLKNDVLLPISLPDFTLGPPHRQDRQDHQINQVIFSQASPPRHIFLTTSDGSIKVCDFPSFNVLHTLYAHTSAATSLQLSPTGKYLATGGSDALIALFDTTDWISQRTLSDYVGAIKGLSFSFDGSYICGACDEGHGIDIYHVETGDLVHTVNTGYPVNCVAWHPCRYWLAWAGDPSGLKIVGAMGGQL